MPSFKNVPKVSDKQLAQAWEDETRIVPKRDPARIAAIPNAVTDAKMLSYITAVQNKITATLKPETATMANKVYNYLHTNSKNSSQAGNMAAAFWIAGKPELSLCVLEKICADDIANTDNLSNYASMLIMLGAQHLAIPVLNNLNAKYPKNSTLLNNLGQAWFGLGEITKAEKYLDSAIAIYAYHPQANLTKAAIEEQKGNLAQAKEAVRKSITHSYTKEKEEKLAKLGDQLTYKDFRMPRRTKADPMNLGGFRAPDFPKSVDECIAAEKAWNEFYETINNKLSLLQKLKEQADQTAMKGHTDRMNADITLVKTAIANPGTKGQFISVPMYADRAAKKYNAYHDLYQKKLDAQLKKWADYMSGDGQLLKHNYEEEIEKLREEDLEQTGEGLPNVDFCPKFKAAADKFLKAINPKLEEMYKDALQLEKEFLNESAYWYMYIQWPDEFEATKLGFQMNWLAMLTEADGMSGFASGYPFVSITQYKCKTQEKEPSKGKLQKFDDVACQYNDTMDLKVMTFYNNCSRMTSKLNLKFLEYSRFDDFERAEGDTYMRSTLKLSVEKGFDDLKWKGGPVKIEAKAGASVEMEFDRDGVKDVILGVEAKAGIGTHAIDDGLEESGSIGGKDIVDTTVEIGVEGRVSLISGHGSVGGTGKLEGIKIANW
jgi:hypothetical protein